MSALGVKTAARADLRVEKVRLDHLAAAMRRTTPETILWACAMMFLTSELFPWFGAVPTGRGLAFVAVIAVTSITRFAVVVRFYRALPTMDAGDCSEWRRSFVVLQIISSAVWGLFPWLLWDGNDLGNHVFLAFACMLILARFMGNRGQQFVFSLAGLLPMTALMVSRFAADGHTPDLVLAGMSAILSLEILFDCRLLSSRVEQETIGRFANEDMARELKSARDEAMRKRFEAESANASKTAFLANMSHELRTPLNAILGFSEIIAKEYLGVIGLVRYRDYAADIHHSGSHLLSLINDLLDVAKIEAGRTDIDPRPIETKQALENALKFLAERATHRRQLLSIRVEPNAGTVLVDERALKQILINLVGNAVKFTPEGGSIAVSAARGEDGDFLLSVEDDGPGIPRDKIEQVFKPFSQIDNRYDHREGGTGLGLALVRGLAELHGGRAWIESDVGEGTRVYVSLPGEIGAAQRLSRVA